jgi:WD40 repeat protein
MYTSVDIIADAELNSLDGADPKQFFEVLNQTVMDKEELDLTNLYLMQNLRRIAADLEAAVKSLSEDDLRRAVLVATAQLAHCADDRRVQTQVSDGPPAAGELADAPTPAPQAEVDRHAAKMEPYHCVGVLEGHQSAVQYLAVDEGTGSLISASTDKTLRIWDVESQRCVAILEGHRDKVLTLAPVNDGLIASGSADKSIRVWDVKSHSCVAVLTGHRGSVLTLRCPSPGWLVSGSSDKTVKLWNVETKEWVAELTGHRSAVFTIANLGDALLASGSLDNTIKVWDLPGRKCVATLVGHKSWVQSIVFIEGESLLVSASADRTIKVWNVPAKRCIRTVDCERPVRSVMHFDGKLVSAGDDTTVTFWELKGDGALFAQLEGHRGAIWAIQSVGSAMFATGAADDTIRLWKRAD